jgi:hypothetical protein
MHNTVAFCRVRVGFPPNDVPDPTRRGHSLEVLVPVGRCMRVRVRRQPKWGLRSEVEFLKGCAS